jgi:DNA polymerase III delta prime subunit
MNAVPDPAQFVYQTAVRKSVGLMTMLAGPSGSGKTLSALRLARGLAGSDGIIAFCDTENDRALYYAERFAFKHLSLSEPFRPAKFEAAAVAAQQQKAVVFICDSFSHEHVGPGGLLDYHEDEMTRMLERQKQQAERYNRPFNEMDARERLKAAGWIVPKGEHKHMLQRLWQLNTHIVLCCQAEKKIALVKNDKGKTDWIDQGFQPICGPDIPYAMTVSFMFAVEKPGVPIVIKPLLDDLKPLIPLDRPIDEATGAAIAAWARGEKEPASDNRGDVKTETGSREETAEPPPSPPPPDSDQREDEPSSPPPNRRHVDEAAIADGARAIGAKFLATEDRAAHLALVDDKELRRQMEWLKRNRRELYEREVNAAIKASWKRTDPKNPASKQGGLMP